MTLLGGSTRTYKTYGKRKTHTINQKSHTLWIDEPNLISRLSLSSSSSSSSALSSDDEDDDSDHEPAFATDHEIRIDLSPARSVKKSLKTYQTLRKQAKVASGSMRRAAAPAPPSDKENVGPHSASKLAPSPLRQVKSQVFVSASPRTRTRARRPLASTSTRSVTLPPLGDKCGPPAEMSTKKAGKTRQQSRMRFEGVYVPPRRSFASKPSSPVLPRSTSTSVQMIVLSDDEDDAEVICTSFGSLSLNKSRTLILEDEDDEDVMSTADSLIEVLPSAPRRSEIASTSLAYPNFLEELLSITSTPKPYDFASFVNSPPSPFSIDAGSRWTKIGEASYSEVFASEGEEGEQMVIKIIPVSNVEASRRDSDATVAKNDGENLPFVSDWTAVQREIWISALVGEGEQWIDGFVEYKGAFIVQGAYPPQLLSEWDRYRRRLQRQRGRAGADEQIRPHVLPNDQVYAIICLAHAGADLESFKLTSWKQAASVLWQAANTCARAEDKLEFEHRDLHWGNLLVKAVPFSTRTLSSDLASLSLATSSSPLDSRGSGLQVTLIDFTLSRAKSSDGFVIFDAFDDEGVFDGQGDPQFNVYRAMRRLIGGDWEGFHPATNLHWLHYLSLKLLHAKKLRHPSTSSASTKCAIAKAEDEKKWYETLIRLEEKLRNEVVDPPMAGKKKSKSKRVGWTSVKELVDDWGGVAFGA